MTYVSILCTTDGARGEKKRNDAVDHLIFFVYLFPSFFFHSLRCNMPSLSTIKGETWRPMQGIARQAEYDPVQANKHTQPAETWEPIPLSTVGDAYYKLKCK
jgi:hypothetical protein